LRALSAAIANFGDATRSDSASSEMAMMASDHRQMWRFRRRARASSFSAMVDRVEASIAASDDAAGVTGPGLVTDIESQTEL
jgi:hypothetical protein